MDNWINLIPISILAMACLYIMLVNDWKKILLAYIFVYFSAYSIIVQYWSFNFSLVKLLIGLMSLVVLGISINKRYEIPSRKSKGEWIFRSAALCLIFIMMIFVVYRISTYLSIPLEIVLASLLIIGFGVFQLGISHETLRVCLAIVMLVFGFDLIFSANEPSLLINGLLALISLLVALMGGFMIVNEFDSGEQ